MIYSLLEDGAQGFGGMSFGKRACSFGDISTTSFFFLPSLWDVTEMGSHFYGQ